MEASQEVERAVQSELIHEHIVEIVSDSGEGAQKAGQTFGAVCARMGNGVWTVEIIPAEIKTTRAVTCWRQRYPYSSGLEIHHQHGRRS